MPVPDPIWLYRFIHLDNLDLLLRRGGLYAPNHTPDDGLHYHTIHDEAVQAGRHVATIPCGPGGTLHDYVPFYFGSHSPMMLQLKTGRVEGYDEGQAPLIYLVTTVEAVQTAGMRYVFSDGHGLATGLTDWFDDPADFGEVDWNMVKQKYWADTLDDDDRQRRKQAEFLVHQFLDWSLIKGIAVINDTVKQQVEAVLAEFPRLHQPPVKVIPGWYY
jgi:hypothetical protein